MFAAFSSLLCGCDEAPDTGNQTVTVRSGRFSVVVSESCEFKPLRSSVMLARASDKIDWILPEGSVVKPGDLVFSQDRTSQKEWLARDSNEVEAAKRNLKEVRRMVQIERDEVRLGIDARQSAITLAATRLRSVCSGASKAALAEAEASLRAAAAESRDKLMAVDAARKLRQKGYLSAAEFEKERLAAELAGINLERSGLGLAKLKSGAGKERRKIAELDLELSKAELEVAKADAIGREAKLASKISDAQANLAALERSVARAKRSIASRQVRAYGSGVVIYRNLQWRGKSKPEVGSRVWTGAGVMDIADLSRMKIRTRLAERYIRHLKVGSLLRVKPDPLQGVTLEARVIWIDRWSRDRSADLAKADREKEGLSGVKVFALEAEVTKADPRIKPGFKGKAEFPLTTEENALIIPLSAVFGLPGNHFVMTAGTGDGRRIPVTVVTDDGIDAAVRGEVSPGQKLLTRDAL